MATLKQLIESEIGDFFAGFGGPGEPETPEEMQSQLLSRVMPLLAGLEQEPVIVVGDDGGDALAYRRLIQSLPAGTKLYAAPQLPQPAVVPTFDEWCAASDNKPLGWVKDAMREAYDGCRAAMLQGAEPVSQPYTLRDGWVAVPVEPTAEMIEATFAGEMELQSVQHQMRNRERRAHYYRAMLAAAPQQE